MVSIKMHKPALMMILLLALAMLVSSAIAGTTGKISGVVKDASTGETLPGVNVLIEGTSQGAATDLDGFYYIIHVHPGSYTLIISSVGYQTQHITDVHVAIDKTTKINVNLQASVIEGEEVVFVAEKPIVEVDRTFAVSSITTEDMEVMPITQVQEVIDLQAGVVDGHFRGGRGGEVVYMLDGIPIQDSYDNSQATQVNNSVVQELQVISGTFNAEYGQAMSGVVNLVSKEGGSEFHGSLASHFGDYFSPHKDEFYNIDDVSPTAIQDYEFSLSGPVPLFPKAGFFINGRLEDNSGWLYGEQRWKTEHQITYTDTGFVPILEHGSGDAVEMNRNEQLYLFGKLSYQVTPKIKFHYTSLLDNRDYRDYDHDWKFNPEGDYNRFRINRTNMAKITQAVSSSLVMEYGYSNTYTQYEHYVYEDPNDSRYVNSYYEEINPGYTLKIGGTKSEHFRRYTNSHTAHSKMSWQLNPIHYIQAGVSGTASELYFRSFNIIHNEAADTLGYDFSQPFYVNFIPLVLETNSIRHDKYKFNPIEYSAYIQDKIELETLIINVGMRFDYFDADGRVLADPLDPNINNPILPEHRALTLEERQKIWYNDVDPKMQISPRIGIAYPISSTGVLHFSYGHFFQRPKYEDLYQNQEYELEEGTGLNTVFGNADLEAEQTISYEFGLQQGLTEDLSIDITLYQRDIRNLVSTDRIVQTYEAGTKYAQFTNRDFGEVRGFIIKMDKRYSDNISASVNYTYQIAEGNASDREDAYNRSKGNNEPITQLTALNWDRRHTISGTVSYYKPADWGVSLIGYYGSGLPYTTEQQGISVGFENDARKPTYWNVDFSAYKFLPFFEDSGMKVSLEMTVKNLFDRLNENDVFKDTGRATYTDRPEDYLELSYINTFDEYFTHSEYYSRPREIRFGISVTF